MPARYPARTCENTSKHAWNIGFEAVGLSRWQCQAMQGIAVFYGFSCNCLATGFPAFLSPSTLGPCNPCGRVAGTPVMAAAGLFSGGCLWFSPASRHLAFLAVCADAGLRLNIKILEVGVPNILHQHIGHGANSGQLNTTHLRPFSQRQFNRTALPFGTMSTYHPDAENACNGSGGPISGGVGLRVLTGKFGNSAVLAPGCKTSLPPSIAFANIGEPCLDGLRGCQRLPFRQY